MPRFRTTDGFRPLPSGRGLMHHECRALRLRNERNTLARRLESVLATRPDIHLFRFQGLDRLAAYAALEPEGVVHATVVTRSGRCLTILAATTRVMRKPSLRSRLFALRRLAEADGRRVLIVTSRGLLNEMGRRQYRSSRTADLQSAQAAAPAAREFLHTPAPTGRVSSVLR